MAIAEVGPGEPLAGPWRARARREVADELIGRCAEALVGVVAVDGRSGAGKTTVAAALAEALRASAVLHTDDFAWHHSFFGWTELLRGVLADARAGRAVSYRPPAWDARGRPGAIEVPAGTRIVIVEGVGAGRRELCDHLDALVWVQSDFAEAERRGIARDGGDAHAEAFWHEWMAEEIPFLLADRPWERADVVVDGTSGPQRTHLLTAPQLPT